MGDNGHPAPPEPMENQPDPLAERFPELTEIQREVAARIKDNQRFLQRFMDDDFAGEELEPGEDEDDFEEL